MQTDRLNLVSIVVVSYNSANFILETLDSIYSQSYSPLELIISDDCSTDNTAAICSEWLVSHNNKFTNVLLLESAQNTGVSANLNRGEAEATGRWVKPIAADDLLLPDAIGKYVNYMMVHPEITYLFGKVSAFGDNTAEVSAFQKNMLIYDFFKMSAREQYKRLMANTCYIPAPSFFYDRKKNGEMHICNDEHIPMIEDWPKWISITKKREKLFLLPDTTVLYRIHSSAISKSSGAMSPFAKSQMLLFIKYQFRYNLLRHPRTSWIKYVKFQQCITENNVWYRIEKAGRFLDKIYCRLRHTSINDWDNMDQVINRTL